MRKQDQNLENNGATQSARFMILSVHKSFYFKLDLLTTRDFVPLQLLWMGVCMAFVGALPNGDFKKWLHYQVYTSCFQILGGAISAVITYHNPENKPKQGICVANHTSPIDVLILACDNAYALVRTLCLRRSNATKLVSSLTC